MRNIALLAVSLTLNAGITGCTFIDPLGDLTSGSCPVSVKGETMVAAGSYCIDRTEVTSDEYQEFLASNSDMNAQPPVCSFWNKSYATTDAPDQGSFPIVNVNWCDAYMYCQWAGKRLCGRIGAGSRAEDAAADPSDAGTNPAVDQWDQACSKGSRVYPYGNTYAPDACNGLDHGVSARASVATMPDCVGGYPGIFDMSGNVEEWTDSCVTGDPSNMGADDLCAARGGDYNSHPAALTCVAIEMLSRYYTDTTIGFRCCSDP